MSTVRDILSVKNDSTHTIDKRATVFEAVSEMVKHNIGALVALDDGVICGIITERDYLRKIAVRDRSSRSTFVFEIMSPDPVTATANTTVEECMSLMAQHRIRHLPVLEEDGLIGMISMRDAVDTIGRERYSQIEALTAYVQGVTA